MFHRRELVPLNRFAGLYILHVSGFSAAGSGAYCTCPRFYSSNQQPLFVSSEMFGTGVFFIISGLFKKAVISDYISVNFVERIFDNPALYSGLRNLFWRIWVCFNRFIVTFPDIVIWLSGLLCCCWVHVSL